MHMIDDIYVERRAASTRSATLHAVHGSDEQRLRGEVSSDSVEMPDYVGLAAIPVRAAGAGGSTTVVSSGFGGTFMPSSSRQPAVIRDHGGRAAENGDVAGAEVYYARCNHDLPADFDGAGSARIGWEPAGDAGNAGLPSNPDVTLRRSLPSGATLDGRASQRHTNGGYNHGLPLSSVQRVQSFETVPEPATSAAGGRVSVYGMAPSDTATGCHPAHGSMSIRQQQQLQQEQRNKFSRSAGDGEFQEATPQQQQERFRRVTGHVISLPRSSGALAGGERMGRPTVGREEIGESYMAVTGSSRCGQSQQKHRSSFTQGVDLPGVPDRNDYQAVSRSAPQLQTLSAAGGHTSAVNCIDKSSVGARSPWYDVTSTDSTTTANTGAIGNFEGVGLRQQAHHPQEHHYQPQPTATVEDRPRYGQSCTGSRGGGDLPSPSPRMERLNASAGRGLESGGSSARNAPPTHVRHSSAAAFAFSAVDTRPLTSPDNTYSATPLHARSRSDGRYDHERVALASRASVSNMIGSSASHGGLGRRELSVQCGQSSHSLGQQQHHNFGNGRWRGAGAVESSVAGGSGFHGAALPSHPEQRLGQTTRSSSQYPSVTSATTSSGRGFNITRRPASHQLDRRYPSGAAGDTNSGSNSFNGSTPSRGMMESPPLVVSEQRRLAVPANPADTFSLSQAEHRAGVGQLTMPVDPVMLVVERNASPEVITTHPACCSHAGGSTGCCVSPPVVATAGVLPRPKNPFEWLQRLQQSRGGKEKCPTTPRTSRSSSMSSLASPARLAALVGGAPAAGDGRACGGHQRSESMAATRSVAYGAGVCPAPDCAGNGDCLPGATPDMLVYEVKFKRATRTFMLGDVMGHRSTCCGDRVKVEADRGEDLGTVHRSLPLSEYLQALYEEKKAKAAKIAENGGGGGSGGEGGSSEGKKKRNKSKKNEDDGGKNSCKPQQQQKKQEEAQEDTCPVKAIKKILRPATAKELEQLEEKIQEEAQILRVCQTKVRNRSLPMKIVDAEYQFDQHKLTLFFEAERRIDFRELVRDLFAVYKTRIWMQQVKDKDVPSSSSTGDKPNTTGCCDDTGGGGALAGNTHTHTAPSPPRVAAAVIPAHDTDHDSGYGSSGSNGDDGGVRRQQFVDVSAPDVGAGNARFDSRVGGGGGVVARHGRSGSEGSKTSSTSTTASSSNDGSYSVCSPAFAVGGVGGGTTASSLMVLPGFNF